MQLLRLHFQRVHVDCSATHARTHAPAEEESTEGSEEIKDKDETSDELNAYNCLLVRSFVPPLGIQHQGDAHTSKSAFLPSSGCSTLSDANHLP
mmetsp:Transcript_14018/g.38516  ORF Transcript_14018/g.38516 Transcript_14018/m.38516 type:complete len:94 (+) Transcript_14018:50-331(+)